MQYKRTSGRAPSRGIIEYSTKCQTTTTTFGTYIHGQVPPYQHIRVPALTRADRELQSVPFFDGTLSNEKLQNQHIFNDSRPIGESNVPHS